jgi:acetyl esterase
VTYARPGGEELRADVWRPPEGGSATAADSAGGRPAIIVVHGGGWRSGERGDFPLWNAWFASKGYVVFDIDYRLSPPPTWREAPADVGCAVGWVKENASRYGVDPRRVVLMGRSAGAHLALLTAYAQGPGTELGCGAGYPHDTGVAAVAAFYPPTDLARLSSRGYLGGMDRFLGGTPKVVPERYRLLSPVSHVDPRDPPTFLVHGGDDQIVPPGQSGLLADRLRGAGVPHHLVGLPWANHTFDFRWGGWGSQITRPTLREFLEDHLATPRGTRNDTPTQEG